MQMILALNLENCTPTYVSVTSIQNTKYFIIQNIQKEQLKYNIYIS